MCNEFLTVDGIIVPMADLTLPRARSFAEAANSDHLPYVSLVECSKESSSESIIIDVSVERPQRTVHDIRATERIAVKFDEDDASPPEVLSLRPDFPWVPHINLRLTEFPRSLCLYDRPWAELSARWTAATFIERIRYWLAATARGSLHQDDQPLEPLLLHNGLRIILPATIYNDLQSPAPLQLNFVLPRDSDECRTLFAIPASGKEARRSGVPFIATTLVANPQAHGLIRQTPGTLAELAQFLSNGGIDLIAVLRERLRDWAEPTQSKAQLAIIVALPLTRSSSRAIEAWNFWVFATHTPIKEVGTDIGLWAPMGDRVGLLMHPDDTSKGSKTGIDILSPYVEFSRNSAATANGTIADTSKIVAIGAGALGSQLVITLARSGVGEWIVVDDDELLPHNIARHSLHARYVGHPKTTGMVHFMDQLYDSGTKGIVANVLRPAEKADELNAAFNHADVILDISASVTVARHLARDVSSPARRVSVFLNPMGTDVVVLAEDTSRTVTLDELEAQYYRAVNNSAALQGHLATNDGRIRYGRSCRDISVSMPTYLVTGLAALASELIRRSLQSPDAAIKVLRADKETLAIAPVEVKSSRVSRKQIADWLLVVDDALLERLQDLRSSKLPNETGGVLLGVYDLDRKTIYVVDTIPSPPDSEEWPTLYIRGSEGLLEEVQNVAKRTGGQLEYVGEWHSHPDGSATRPSPDDIKVFAWLTEHMATAGLPALMAIVGEQATSGWYVGQIIEASSWQVRKQD